MNICDSQALQITHWLWVTTAILSKSLGWLRVYLMSSQATSTVKPAI